MCGLPHFTHTKGSLMYIKNTDLYKYVQLTGCYYILLLSLNIILEWVSGNLSSLTSVHSCQNFFTCVHVAEGSHDDRSSIKSWGVKDKTKLRPSALMRSSSICRECFHTERP
ncbi:UNVERIFIED_CONTAM: hypothetical protein K2H54_059005 [Gekko kuhli]